MSLSPPHSCVELLQQMVSFDTVNRVDAGEPFAEARLAEYLEQLGRQWGLTTERLPCGDDAYNLLITSCVDETAPWILFDSHLDTVSADGMSIDPFAARIADGKLHGRGACDTKGTGAAMLWALQSLAAARSLPTNVGLLFSIDEEVTRTGVRAFVEHQLDALSWRPAAVIVGEPTQLKMVTAHNGLVRWRIATRGVAAHSSEPSNGRSAISDMVRVIDAIESNYVRNLAVEHPMVGRAQCSINLIEGGQQINVIPDLCTIALDRRLIPGENPDEVLPAVEEHLQVLREQDPGLRVEQSPPRVELGLNPKSNAELAGKVGEILASFQLSSASEGAKYGTHASSFAAAGIPSLVIGPGDIAQAHSKDEFLDLQQLELGERVYAAIMSQDPSYWTSVAPDSA